MSPRKYLEIANDLRRRLESDEFPIGSVLPGGYLGLAEHYGTSRQVLSEALSILELEGWIMPRRGLGIVVLDRQAPERIDRGRIVYRDQLGYFFTRVAATWSPVATPTREWGPAPHDVAAELRIDPGAEVLIRRRVLGPTPTQPMQIVATYIPADLARGTILEDAHTGPGGILDRLEQDMGHGPLSWSESQGARMPEPDESKDLRISRQVPLLVFMRAATSGTEDRVVTVDSVVMSAARFKVVHSIERDESATWPTSVATSENPPTNDTPKSPPNATPAGSSGE